MDKWLNHNNVAKVIALVFSIILWAMVHLDTAAPIPVTSSVNTKYIENVQIQVIGFDESKYAYYDLDTDKVNIEVKGKRTDITTNFSDYKVKLDLSHAKPGTMTLPLTTEFPPGVQLVSMDPANVTITIEAKETKEFPISIVTKGKLDSGLLMGTPVIANEQLVKVTLPKSDLTEVDKVQGIIDITGLEESVKGKSVKLVAYDKQGKELKHAVISPSTVEVEVPINKLYKTVPLEVRTTGKLPDGYTLSGISKDVEGVAVYGSKEVLQGISSYPITLDLNQYKAGTDGKYTVNLTPPAGFEKIEPSSATFVLQIEPAGQKYISNIPVTLINGSDKLTAKITTAAESKISLTVIGSEKLLNTLKPSDIVVSADLSNLGVGTHRIPVNVKLPSYLELDESDKSHTIEVQLTEPGEPANTVPDHTGENQGDNATNSPPTEEEEQVDIGESGG